MDSEQHVCTICGYNMIGFLPKNCPFCGAPDDVFLASEECSRKFRVKEERVNDSVLRLSSVPKLGLEHSAYRVETGGKIFWIDCPSCFDDSLEPADVIIFTHHHFLGASNQYRELFSSSMVIHRLDSEHSLSGPFTFDHLFEQDFVDDGLKAVHVGGHTRGFTFYIFRDTLFICDYVHIYRDEMRFNPFGPQRETADGGLLIREILRGRDIKRVCGFNYVESYSSWADNFKGLTERNK
jgi:hypothetical protein